MEEVAWWEASVHAEIVKKYGPPFDEWRWIRNAGLCRNIQKARGLAQATNRLRQLLSPAARAANFDYEGVGMFHDIEPKRPLALAIYLPVTRNLRLGGPDTLYLEWFSARPSGSLELRNTFGFGHYLLDWLLIPQHYTRHQVTGFDRIFRRSVTPACRV